ncbi:MAG: SpoIIE family protein phosphatase, partial [Planctomycetia bacterium]|nr:SpoIIE family protein phosphatase [Planctomycetia bacterium]
MMEPEMKPETKPEMTRSRGDSGPGRLFVDVGVYQRRKSTEHAYGDVFVSRRISEEGRLIAVLSDGLGSGVKAGILAGMTATMALRFTAAELDILRSAEVIMDALPVCQVRHISYATFSIIDCHADGTGRIIEEGNPEFIHLRGNARARTQTHRPDGQIPEEDASENEISEEGASEPAKQILPSTKWPDRRLLVSTLRFEAGDRLIFCSDGVTQAGLGSDAWPLGWRREGLLAFVRQVVHDQPEIPSRQLAREIVDEAIRHEPGRVAKDDTSAVVFHFR